MDCKTARSLLEFFSLTSPELQDEEKEALEKHLTQCSECELFARSQQIMDQHLGEAIREIEVPSGLKKQLLTQVKENQREQSRRRWQRIAGVAVAAMILLAIGGYFLSRPASRMRLNPEEICRTVSVPHMGTTRVSAEEWFENRNVKPTLPERLNYQHLAFYKLTPIHQKEVPHLFFVKGGAQLELFVLSEKQFDISDLPDGYMINSGGFNVEIWRAEHNAYLLVYKNRDLTEFLE